VEEELEGGSEERQVVLRKPEDLSVEHWQWSDTRLGREVCCFQLSWIRRKGL
jgi:hypothetical protein